MTVRRGAGGTPWKRSDCDADRLVGPATERGRPMTNEVRYESYVNGRMAEDMETFRAWLEERGLAEATIHDRIRFAEHCQRVLGGDVDPREATTEHIDLLRLRMSHVSDRTRRGYIRAWMDFVRAVNEGVVAQQGLPYWKSENFYMDLQLGMAELYRCPFQPDREQREVRPPLCEEAVGGSGRSHSGQDWG